MTPQASVILFGLIALTACSQPDRPSRPATGVVQATDAVCRPSAPGRRMALCYVTLTASQADSLVSAAAPMAARTALHDVPIQNGMVVLQPRSQPIALPAGQPVRLAPGGQALVLQGMGAPLQAGRTVPLTLTFGATAPLEIMAPVEREQPAA